jgi:hypothetical protein
VTLRTGLLRSDAAKEGVWSLRQTVAGTGENYIMRSFMICAAHQILLFSDVMEEMRWVSHVARMAEKRCIHSFGGENLKEGDHLEGWGSMGGCSITIGS